MVRDVAAPTPPRVTVRRVASDLASVGMALHAGLIPAAECDALRRAAVRLHQADGFRAARVGHGAAKILRPDIRSDQVRWIDAQTATGPVRRWCERIERLRVAINRATYAGLFEWEGHFAHYGPGAQYRRHIDTHRGDPARRISTILYLNPNWQPGDGGELRIWLGAEADAPFVDVPPVAGTLVAFASDTVPHAVLPSNTARYSIAGWFRTR